MAMKEPLIRPEVAADEQAIHALTEEAFRGKPYAGGDEQDLVDRLRSIGALTLSLVAVADGQVRGHVAISPASADDGEDGWFALGPVSVLPAHQGVGTGGRLVRAALEALRERGARGCILTGSTAYYPRFGFELAPAQAPENEPAEHFMLYRFDAGSSRGVIRFHEAFYSES